VATDRLPALSGLAGSVSDPEPDAYLGGIWASELPGSLLWMSYSDDSSRHEQYYAPSWSWASLTDRVKYGYTSTGTWSYCEILGHSHAPATGNPFGPLRDGFITLKGEVVKFQVPEIREAVLREPFIPEKERAERTGLPVGPNLQWDVKSRL